jgi:hypothetical protein
MQLCTLARTSTKQSNERAVTSSRNSSTPRTSEVLLYENLEKGPLHPSKEELTTLFFELPSKTQK